MAASRAGAAGEVQVGSSREHRQGLVGGVAAQISAQIQGVEGWF